MVEVATGSSGTRAVSSRYPTIEGLIAGTTKQTKERSLKPEKSFLTENETFGVD